MSTDALRKVQEKLFRGGTPDGQRQVQERDLGLTIDIPKPPATPTPPPKKGKAPDGSPRQVEESKEQQPYRQRLAQALGEEYKGAEKYRLQQDDHRDKHWKRWGPYLSDRQWVGILDQRRSCLVV